MGKKKERDAAIGKSLIKDRFSKHRKGTKAGDSFLHTSDLNDGFDWNRLNLQSVTDQNTLEEFLTTAQLAGTEFTAEKLNIKFVDPNKDGGLLTEEELQEVKKAQGIHKELLKIPRRPIWDEDTTAEELDQAERESFLDWRRQLSELQDIKHLVLTPFERNLEFWRQLWRVIERSDVIVQIVDGRNPLLFRCQDLEKYVKEVSSEKTNMILINKADHLTPTQRLFWAKYFNKEGINVAFWSAVEETERNKQKNEVTESDSDAYTDEEEEYTSEEDEECSQESDIINDVENRVIHDKPDPDPSVCHTLNDVHLQRQSQKEVSMNTSSSESRECPSPGSSLGLGSSSGRGSSPGPGASSESGRGVITNTSKLLDGTELVEFIRNVFNGERVQAEHLTVGMVGYPNVGKSSTINALLQTKKVPVSATPGRTKHFQTLFLEKDLMLCDCPGLVMPTFVSTKAEMVTSGILPIDQMRDYVPPISLVCSLIPRPVLESMYGILLPHPAEGEDPERPPTAHELLSAYGYMRGYMTHKGIPDFQRSARCILKDYMNGKLLYCFPPPGIAVEDFCPTLEVTSTEVKAREVKQAVVAGRVDHKYKNEVDKNFFHKCEAGFGSKGVQGVVGFTRMSGYSQHHSISGDSSTSSVNGKPWKKQNKHKKREKLRRIHKHLDA